MAALGVTWNSVGMPGDSLDHAVEALEQYVGASFSFVCFVPVSVAVASGRMMRPARRASSWSAG